MSNLDRASATILFEQVCDFVGGHSLPEEAVLSWLEDNGGHCDCEALANAELVVEEAVLGYRDWNRPRIFLRPGHGTATNTASSFFGIPHPG